MGDGVAVEKEVERVRGGGRGWGREGGRVGGGGFRWVTEWAGGGWRGRREGRGVRRWGGEVGGGERVGG